MSLRASCAGRGAWLLAAMRVISTVAVGAPAAVAQPVSAQFAVYQSLCLRAEGDPARVLSVAQASGWTAPTPAEMLPLGDLSMADGQQRVESVGGRRLHLAVGHANDPAQLGAAAATPWRVCILTQDPADGGAAQAMQAWAGVAPMQDADAEPGSALFVTTGAGPNRRSVQGLSEAAVHALVQTGDITAMGVKTAGGSTILLYARPGA